MNTSPLVLTPYRVRKAAVLSGRNKEARLKRCKMLLAGLHQNSHLRTFFSDEKLFTQAEPKKRRVRSQGWSGWTDKPGAVCNDTCGAFGRIEQVRTCLGGNNNKCQGESERLARCNFGSCFFPRPACQPGTVYEVKDKQRICTPQE
ncbi:unnamed protein product [Caenorhabditis auriculariae]|uniref:Uncharacterized protein n=1 Tax=Caenorhabditis auriculariae TaxID=2777116 RepID=A0A8S1HX08_9PELO|nr:unnamed protein product [Caenorhabditis auriculariae]